MLTDLKQVRVAPTLNWQEEFGTWLHGHDRMPKTVEAYLQDARHFAAYFERINQMPFSPEQLNATDVKSYFAAQDADKTVAPTTRNRRLASLRVLVEWSVDAGILEYDPTVSVKRVKFETTPRDRSADEMASLSAVVANGLHIQCAGHGHTWLALRDRVLFALFTETGLRIHEVGGLNVEDLDFDACVIHVMGKGAKKATINVPNSLMSMLREWVELNHCAEALIIGWNHKRISTGQIRRRIQMIGNAAGLRDLKPHDLRHTYAYRLSDSLVRQGLNSEKALDGVRKQLRHGDSKTTLQYFRVRESQIRAAVEAM
jgi:integrase/recombinase XerC